MISKSVVKDKGRRWFHHWFSLLDINAQARKLQRNRAKGTMTLQHGSSFCRSLSETSLNLVGMTGEEPKRYSTLPGSGRARSDARKEGGGVKHSLYQSPHLLLLQGYNRQVSDKLLSNHSEELTWTALEFSLSHIWCRIIYPFIYCANRTAWFTC